jgi:hypothetical protein
METYFIILMLLYNLYVIQLSGKRKEKAKSGNGPQRGARHRDGHNINSTHLVPMTVSRQLKHSSDDGSRSTGRELPIFNGARRFSVIFTKSLLYAALQKVLHFKLRYCQIPPSDPKPEDDSFLISSDVHNCLFKLFATKSLSVGP